MWLCCSNARGNLPFPLSEGTFLIGRSPECQIIVLDSTVSPVHARLTCLRNQPVWIEDLGSLNGTLVNGAQISRRQISAGVRLFLGKACLGLSSRPEFLEGRPAILDRQTLCADLQSASLPDAKEVFTPKQYEVYLLLLQGILPKEIAARFERHYCTVYEHVQVIYEVFGVHSQPALMAKIFRTDEEKNLQISHICGRAGSLPAG